MAVNPLPFLGELVRGLAETNKLLSAILKELKDKK